MPERNLLRWRLAKLVLLAAAAILPAGCSDELTSYDDQYVPYMPDSKFPIRVVERPMKLTLDVPSGRIAQDDQAEVSGFAREAVQSATSPVTVAYPSGSRQAREAASQAVSLLTREGVARSRITMSRYEGRSSTVTLSFTSRYAATKPCGDFSENLRSNSANNTSPNLGCSVQQNIAASVTNPEDFVHGRTLSRAQSAPQNPALKKYYDGTWTVPTTTGSTSSSQ